MNKMKILNVEIFEWKEWDDLDGENIMYYNVKWLLDSLKKYDNNEVSLNNNGDVIIYDNNKGNESKEFNIGSIKEFREKINEMYKEKYLKKTRDKTLVLNT